MKKEKLFHWLRILGMGMLLIGIFVPWFQLGFELIRLLCDGLGWKIFWIRGSLGVQSILEDGPDLYSTLFLLEGLGGVGLICYLFYSGSAVRKVREGNKVLSLY